MLDRLISAIMILEKYSDGVIYFVLHFIIECRSTVDLQYQINIRNRHCLPLTNALFHPLLFGGIRVAYLLSFLYCVFLLWFVCLRVLNVPNVSGLSIHDYSFGFL